MCSLAFSVTGPLIRIKYSLIPKPIRRNDYAIAPFLIIKSLAICISLEVIRMRCEIGAWEWMEC